MPGTSISFDGNSLQTANILTSDIAHEQYPAKNVVIYALAHNNGSVIPYISYPSKTIRVSGKITDTTIAGLDSRLDSFRAYFTGQDKNLDIGYNGTTRRYIATANNISIDRPGGLTYANFEVELIAPQPFGQDTSSTTALNATGRTSSSYSDAYTFLGTAPVQRPVFTLSYSVVTGGTGATVSIGNNSTGQNLSITRNWAASDILIVDVSARTVTVNGTAVAFSGAFPEFATGSQTFTYSDTLTTRTFTENIIYYPLYL